MQPAAPWGWQRLSLAIGLDHPAAARCLRPNTGLLLPGVVCCGCFCYCIYHDGRRVMMATLPWPWLPPPSALCRPAHNLLLPPPPPLLPPLLQEVGLQSDADFAEVFARSKWRQSKWGAHKLRTVRAPWTPHLPGGASAFCASHP